MSERYWTLDQRFGGAEKAALLIVEQYGVASTDEISKECGFQRTEETKAALEVLEANGLIVSIDVTTLQEQILLMDWLRCQDAIGFDCVDEEGEFVHMPEQSPEELKDYEEWERDLRKGGEPGEQAYKLILWAAKREWGRRFREAWQDGPAMTERTLAWAYWRRSVQDSCG